MSFWAKVKDAFTPHPELFEDCGFSAIEMISPINGAILEAVRHRAATPARVAAECDPVRADNEGIAMFGALKKAFKAGATEVRAEYAENKDFLEAVCAAVALVANADGSIEESERRKAVSVVTNHSTLSKLYRIDDVEKCLDTMLKRAKDASGRQQLGRELDDIKTRPNAAQMAEDVYLIAADIAAADGNVGPEEAVVLEKIARRIGVDPTRFEF